jgi:D-arginine dehydrogenase
MTRAHGEFDIAIFGAGIAGASVAYQVAGQRSCVLIEREAQPGYHSTGRSAAMFIESYGPPAVRALTRASRAFYERPPSGWAEPLLTPRGALHLAVRGQEALLERTRGELMNTCPGLQILEPEAALEKVPCLRAEVMLGALFEPTAHDIDVHALHQGFLRGFRQREGVQRTEMTLERAARTGSAWELQFAGGEVLRARVVVDAAGAWADEIAATFGAAPIGLEPRRRTAFTFRAPEGIDVSGWPAVIGVDESYYFKPDAGRLLGSPANADPTTPHDVMPEELDVALGIHRIQEVTTFSIRRPESAWAGLRSFVRDGEIVVGWDDTCPGFFWLAAQGGYGIQSAAAASELAAALLMGLPVPRELRAHGVHPDALSPGRLR